MVTHRWMFLGVACALAATSCSDASTSAVRDGSVDVAPDVTPDVAIDVAPTDVGRAPNFSLHFEGDRSQVVDFGDVGALNGASAYTVQVWVRFDRLGVYDTVFAKRTSDDRRAAVLQTFMEPSALGVAVNAGYGSTALATLRTRTWYHLALVFDASLAAARRLTLYRNGERLPLTFLAPVGVTTPSDASRFTVGAEYDGLTPITETSALAVPLSGNVDELAIWRVALGAAAVQALYHEGVPVDASRDSGAYDASGELVNYWRFDEGSGTLAADARGAFPGTLLRGVTWSPEAP